MDGKGREGVFTLAVGRVLDAYKVVCVDAALRLV